jgi:hypothetical protein
LRQEQRILVNVTEKAGSAAVPLLIAVIGATGGVLVTGLLPQLTPFFNEPVISTNITKHMDDPNISDVSISNIGRGAATNMSITIVSPSNVTAIKTKLAPVKLNSITHEENIIQLNVPRMVEGAGSMITIEATFDKSINGAAKGFYRIYSVYDQGSAKITLGPKEMNTTASSDWLTTYWRAYWWIYLPIIGIFSAQFGYLAYLLRRSSRKEALKRLSDNILTIRKTLNLDPEYQEALQNLWLEIPYSRRKRLFQDVKDYMAVDDFFTSLVEWRNLKIDCRKIDKLNLKLEVVVLNHKILASAENILRNVNAL